MSDIIGIGSEKIRILTMIPLEKGSLLSYDLYYGITLVVVEKFENNQYNTEVLTNDSKIGINKKHFGTGINWYETSMHLGEFTTMDGASFEQDVFSREVYLLAH